MMAEKHISEYLGIIDPFLRKLIIGYFSSFTAKTILGLIESKLQKLKKERERKRNTSIKNWESREMKMLH